MGKRDQDARIRSDVSQVRRFAHLPGWLFERGFIAKLSAPALRLFCALAYHADRKGQCWPSRDLLCKETGISRGRFYKTVGELEEKHLVVRHRFRRDGMRWPRWHYTLAVQGPYKHQADAAKDACKPQEHQRDAAKAKPETGDGIRWMPSLRHLLDAVLSHRMDAPNTAENTVERTHPPNSLTGWTSEPLGPARCASPLDAASLAGPGSEHKPDGGPKAASKGTEAGGAEARSAALRSWLMTGDGPLADRVELARKARVYPEPEIEMVLNEIMRATSGVAGEANESQPSQSPPPQAT